MPPSFPVFSPPELGLPRILLIDDDIFSGTALCSEMAKVPFDVRLARSSAQGLSDACSQAWAAVVIDLRSPTDSGLELCKNLLLHRPRTPIILVTETRNSFYYLLGLEIGASDCLSRPYDPQEMVVRLKGIVRRSVVYLGE